MDYLQISKLTNYLYTFTCLNDEFTLCAEDGLSDPTLYWIALSQLLCFGDDLDSLPEAIHFNQYFNSTLPTALKVGPALHQYSALSSTEVSFYTKCAVSCLAKLLRQSKVLDSTSQLTLKSISRLAHNLYHYDEFAFTAKATPSIVHPFYLSTDISRFFYHLLRKRGYVVLENYLLQDFLHELHTEVSSIQHQEYTSGNAYLYGQSHTLQRVYNLFSKSPLTRQLYVTEPILDILRYFYQRPTLHPLYCLSSVQSNHLHPGADPQNWHVDNSLPPPIPLMPIRLNINLNLDLFSESNGATQVVPFSHNSSSYPNITSNTITSYITAPPGSLIVWDGSLWHRSTANRTSQTRSAILACFCNSIFRELSSEESYPLIINSSQASLYGSYFHDVMGFSHGIK